MPTSSPGDSHCGTNASGWLSGAYPSVAESAVTQPVCFAWNGNPCNFSTQIQVLNCGAFYVFKLGAPGKCNRRYCGTD